MNGLSNPANSAERIARRIHLSARVSRPTMHTNHFRENSMLRCAVGADQDSDTPCLRHGSRNRFSAHAGGMPGSTGPPEAVLPSYPEPFPPEAACDVTPPLSQSGTLLEFVFSVRPESHSGIKVHFECAHLHRNHENVLNWLSVPYRESQ